MTSNNTSSRNIEWKIKNANNLKDGNRVSSGYFEIPVDNKIIKLYFNVEIKESELGIYLYLSTKSPKLIDYSIKCEFFIWTLSNEKVKNEYIIEDYSSFEDSGYGSSSLISIAELFENSQKYLNDETLTIGAKVEIIKTATESLDPSTTDSEQNLAAYQDYFERKSYSDLTFVCSDSGEIQAHRLILAAASPVLRSLIDFGPSNIIKVKDIDGGTMSEIFRFIYTGKVNNINEYAPKLIYGAQKYELDGLKKLCVTAMIKNLSVENAVDYFLLGDQYDAKELLDSCMKFIKENHQVILKNDENWEKLDKKHLRMFLDFYEQSSEYILILESSF